MATFWDEYGTSGWAETAVKAAKPVTAKPSKEDIHTAWNANKDDPAKIYELMQQNGLSVTDVSNALGADRKAFFNYLSPIFASTQESSGAGDNLEIRDVYKYGTGQAEYSDSHSMSRDDFLKKYGKTFVADDKGGNAASEVAGQDVGAYYDRYLAPGAKGDLHTTRGAGDNLEMGIADYTMPTFGWKYRDSNPYFDAWDNVNPHPESQDLGGVGEFWRQIGRPVATAAAMYAGVGALSGAAGGAGATAGGVGTGGSAGIGSGTVLGGGSASVSPGILQTFMSSPYAQPAMNAVKTLASGGDLGDAALAAGGSYLGGQASGILGGGVVGNIGGSVVNAAVTGKDPLKTLVSSGVNAAAGVITGNVPGFDALSPAQQSAVNTMVASALKGKNPTQALIASVTKLATSQVAGAKSAPSNTKTGGWAA